MQPSSTSSITDIDEVALLDCANSHSFNQAYIYCEIAPLTPTITLDQSELKDFFDKYGTKKDYLKINQRSNFNTKIKQLYTAILEGGTTAKEQVRKDEIYNKVGIHKVILELAEHMKINFSHNINIENRVKKAKRLANNLSLSKYWKTNELTNDSNTGIYDKYKALEQLMESQLKKEGFANDGKNIYINIPNDRIFNG